MRRPRCTSVPSSCPRYPRDSHQHSFTSSLRESCVRHRMTMKEVAASEDSLLLTSTLPIGSIVVNAEEEEEADVLIDRLDTTTIRYKIENGPAKTKVMANKLNGFQREIRIKGQSLEIVTTSSAWWDQSPVIKDPITRFFSGLSRQKQLYINWISFRGTSHFNPYYPGVPFVGRRQTVRTHIRRHRGLHCLLTEISIKNRIKTEQNTRHPYNWKWTRPFDKDGKVH